MSKESEGIFDDSVVYVTKQGSQVGVDGGRITIYMKGEGELASFPMGQVDTINIFGNINFTTPFVAEGCVSAWATATTTRRASRPRAWRGSRGDSRRAWRACARPRRVSTPQP